MRKLIFLSLSIFQIACFSYEKKSSNLKENNSKFFNQNILTNSSKFYIDITDIYLDRDVIYVRLNDEWVRINSLQSDEKGIYVDNLWPFLPFYCENCGTWNESWRINCKKCLLRRPD